MKANDIRNGQILRIEGKLFRVLSFQHRTPGNLRAFVQAKLRDLKTGAQNEFRFSSTEELERVSLDTRQMQYLYHDAAGYHFMDNDTYDQVALADLVLQQHEQPGEQILHQRLRAEADGDAGHAGGRLATRTDRKGVVTTYSYDTAGRLVGKTYSDGTTPPGSYT